jgi:hypothetical protein
MFFLKTCHVIVIFSGKLRDITGSYDMSFRTCGCFFILASILIFCEQVPLKYQRRHKKQREGSTEEESTHLKSDPSQDKGTSCGDLEPEERVDV